MKSTIRIVALLLPVLGMGLVAGAQTLDQEFRRSPVYESPFWDHWGDGQAELAGYDLTYVRYGETRHGTAITVFVTEPVSRATRVKVEGPVPDQFQAMKLNLIRDFSTGVYDYNLMTSSFLALEPVAGRPAGTPTKVSFTAQEWCGHVFQQLLFDGESVREVLHSYFQGEADREQGMTSDPTAVSEDTLLIWARELAYPLVAPGESATVPLFTSLERSRMEHVDLRQVDVTLSRAPETRSIEVPAGRFEVRRSTAVLDLGDGETRRWEFDVELAAPHRLIAWSSSTGERAELLGAERMKYWQLQDADDVELLTRLGLGVRPARTP